MNEPKLQKDAAKSQKTANLTEIFLWILFTAAIILKCSHFQFSVQLNNSPYFSLLNLNMYLATITSVLIITSFIFLFFNRKRLLVLFVADFLITLLVFSDTIYYRYYYNAITVPVLHQIGLVGSLKDSIRSLFNTGDLIFIADLPIIAAVILAFRQIAGTSVNRLRPLNRIITAVIVFVIGFGLFQVSYGFSPSGAFTYDNNNVVNTMGALYFHYYDLKRYIKDNYFTNRNLTSSEKSQLDTYYKEKAPSGSNYKGAAKGKNLIVIQVEALQQFVIGKTINGREITPNLNKFIKESAYFDNYFYQIGAGNTSDAEFLSNTSLYPLKEGSVYFMYPTNTFDSTANLLKAQGYNTYVFHANNPSFWNRTEMYRALGFDRFFSNKDYEFNDALGWGLSDESFFKQAVDKIDTSKPFYGFFITLSSHYPFNYFDDYKDFDAGKYNKTFLGDYLKAASYADKAIGSMFDDLKKRGLYDNSVIVIYGDHYAISMDHADQLEDFLGFKYNAFNWTMLQKTPCFIRFPGMDNTGVHSVTAGEVDIEPTIANLMGFENKYALGKDLFNIDKGYAILRSGTVITDDFAYLSSDSHVYTRQGKALDMKDYDSQIKNYQHELAISDIILKKNALKQYLK